MDQLELEINNRNIQGKKVRLLRRQGITPVHVFGHGITSLGLQSNTAKLQRILAQAGETSLISLKIVNEKISRPVLVREVQREPITGELLHVDFYQVQMGEKVEVDIPIVFVGEAPALKMRENTLMHEIDVLTVECLPAKIPSVIEVNVNSLTEPEQTIRVKDIDLGPDVTILTNPEQVLAKVVSQPAEKVIAEEVKAEPLEETPTSEEKPKQE